MIGCKKLKTEKEYFFFFHTFKMCLTIAFLSLSIIVFYSPAFAGVFDSPDKDNTSLVKDKETVINRVSAPTADNKLDNKGNVSPINIEADTLDYDKVSDAYHAKGNVKIIYGGAILSADDIQLDNKNNVATAQGNAFLKMGEDTLRGEKIIFNIEEITGSAYEASAFYARNNFHVKGDKIEKTGKDTYFIKKPSATTCDGDKPDWQITGSEMKVTIEGYGLMNDARFLAKGLPVFYSPYLPFPAKTKRQSGLILPYLAYSRDKDGVDIEIPYFWAISPQMDATFYQRYIEKRGFKEGAEFRYYLGEKSFGTFYGDYMEDTRHVTETADIATSRDWQESHRRWSYYLNHQTNFDSQFYLRTDLEKVSDKWYFKDFSAQNYYLDNFAQTAQDSFKNVPFKGDKSLRYLTSTVRVYKGWSNYNLTGMINSTEDFAAVNNEQTLQKYPEIALTGVKQPFLNTPLYYEFTGAYDYLYRGEGEKGHFVDLSPSISLPFNISDYVKVNPQFTLKETFWSRDDDQLDSKEKTNDRTIYNASVSLSSQISRIFDGHAKNWEKIRHEIKPEIIYSYVPDVSIADVPGYYLPISSPFIMPVTSLSSNTLTQQNAVAWSLTNTLTARVKDEKGAISYLEFLRFKLFQTYDMHEGNKDITESTSERRPFSNMGIELDFTPNKYFSFKSRNQYNFYDSWKQNNFDLHFKDVRGDSMSVGYRYTADSIEEINFGLKAVMTGNIDGTFISKYDLLNSRKIENSLGFVYHKQCWSMGMDFVKTDDDFRFLFRISLAGLSNMGSK
jgi:LPS-assembly protein